MAQRIPTLVLLIEILFLFNYVSQIARTAADHDGDVIQVTGKVMCHDCTFDNSSKPINGGRVSITCTNNRGRVSRYHSSLTDDRGQFDFIVDGKNLNPSRCAVRIVSSPDQSCNILTNAGGGKSGVNLSQPFMVSKDLVKFEVGPFYYVSPMCPDPPKYENN